MEKNLDQLVDQAEVEKMVLEEFLANNTILWQGKIENNSADLTISMPKDNPAIVHFAVDSPMSKFVGHFDIKSENYDTPKELVDQLIKSITETFREASLKIAEDELARSKPAIN